MQISPSSFSEPPRLLQTFTPRISKQAKPAASSYLRFFSSELYPSVYDRYLFVKKTGFFLQFLGAMATLVQNETMHSTKHREFETLAFFLVFVIATLEILWLFLERKCRGELEVFSEYLFEVSEPNRVRKGKLWLGLSVFYRLIVPLPFFSSDELIGFVLADYDQKVDFLIYYNDLLAMLRLFRTLVSVHDFVIFSKLNHPSIYKELLKRKIVNPKFFVMKSFVQDQGVGSAFAVILVYNLIFSVIFRIAERENPIFNFSSLFDSFYFCFITICTIGYGDYYPVTLIGRIVTFLLMFVGIFTVSLLTTSMIQLRDFSLTESICFNQWQKKQVKRRFSLNLAQYALSLKRLYRLSVCLPSWETRFQGFFHFQMIYFLRKKLMKLKLKKSQLNGESLQTFYNNFFVMEYKNQIGILNRVLDYNPAGEIFNKLDEKIEKGE